MAQLQRRRPRSARLLDAEHNTARDRLRLSEIIDLNPQISGHGRLLLFQPTRKP
jgi:hypothetical protein